MRKQPAYLFGTCLIDTFYPRVGLDAIYLLELAGYEVVYPTDQACCGQAPYNSGFLKESEAAASQTIHTFSDQAIPLIVPSASCASMIKYHYPRLFRHNSEEHDLATSLADRTYELVDFILDKLPYDRLDISDEHKFEPTPVTLHLSCAALREMKVADAWIKLCERLPAAQVHLPKYYEECCGFGGTFAVKSASVSSVMTEDKVKHLQACPGKQIVSGDCGCLMNISSTIEHQCKRVSDCLSIASFVANQFRQAALRGSER